MKIVTLDIPLSDDHRRRLKTLGELKEEEAPTSKADLLAKTKGADVIYSYGDFLLESLEDLVNVFVTYPYVELGSFDSKNLKKNGVLVANAQGGNKNSIVEWVMFMCLALFRNFLHKVRVTADIPFELNESLEGKNVVIIGKGSIGTEIAQRCQAFGMSVSYFERSDDLNQSVKDADLIINALNSNPTSEKLLDRTFFTSLKKGSYFISFVRQFTYDLEGMLEAIDNNIIAGAAIDCDPEDSGNTSNDFYQKALSNPKVLVTPHIAFATTLASQRGLEIAVKNIETYAAGEPINILVK